MSLLKDVKTLFHLVKPIKGGSHKERLENFYSGQSVDYDDFRKRLLHGRETLMRKIDWDKVETWVDLGGGTGSNLELVAQRVPNLKKVWIVDLSDSLLKVAEERAKSLGWDNVETVSADATSIEFGQKVDLVTFSYSLTMIPDWYACVDNAFKMLIEGGQIASVDFYVARKYPSHTTKHGWLTRHFWPAWFGFDNVFLSQEHVPYLHARFKPEYFAEYRSKVPYIPGVKVPYYQFVGVKDSSSSSSNLILN